MIESIIKTIPLFRKLALHDLTIKKLGGLTNNNYLISTKEQRYILRIPRPSTHKFINRKNEAYNAEITQQLGIAPKCLWRGEGDEEGISLSKFINNAKSLDGDNQKAIDRFAKTLTILQSSKKSFKGTLNNISIATKLKQYFKLCSIEQQKLLRINYQKTLSLLESLSCDRENVPSHIDLITENILIQDDKVWFIDWEYSAMASPFWDIAIFCNSADLDSTKSEKLLKQILINCQKTDLQCFKHYRFITRVVSECWCSAFEN